MQNVLKKRNYQNEAYQVNVFFLISKESSINIIYLIKNMTPIYIMKVYYRTVSMYYIVKFY